MIYLLLLSLATMLCATEFALDMGDFSAPPARASRASVSTPQKYPIILSLLYGCLAGLIGVNVYTSDVATGALLSLWFAGFLYLEARNRPGDRNEQRRRD